MTTEELMRKYPWTCHSYDTPFISIALYYHDRFEDDEWDAMNKTSLSGAIETGTLDDYHKQIIFVRLYKFVNDPDYRNLKRSNNKAWLDIFNNIIEINILQSPLSTKAISSKYPWLKDSILTIWALKFSRVQLEIINEFNLAQYLTKDQFSVFFVGSILSSIHHAQNSKPICAALENGTLLFKNLVKEVVEDHQNNLKI
ncbi:MAG: hypothetical protein WC627_00990 [Legionella sp.]|jgi:hypothetical protein